MSHARILAFSVTSVFAMFGLGAVALSAAAQTYGELTVAGDVIDNGFFDPSVEYLPDGSVGWLAYSSVSGDAVPWGPKVETHLAKTLDHGATWTFERKLNASIPGVITLSDGVTTLSGIWNYEVATLVYHPADPADPNDPGSEWKLFAHRIFRPIDPTTSELQARLPQYSWIVVRTATDPGGTWSPEVALFGSTFFPPAPYATQVNVNLLDPSLAPLIVYSEPGAFYRNGVLYVSMTGLLASGADRIVLLASDDHGATWRYVSTPVSNADMPAIGFTKLDGTAIVEQAGRVFLLGTPERPGLLHDGTLVFEFADLATGVLRTQAGKLLVHKHIPPQPALLSQGFGGGQSDFHEANSAGGILMPQLEAAAVPHLFHIFETNETPLGLGAVPALGPRGPVVLIAAFAVLAWLRLRRAPG